MIQTTLYTYTVTNDTGLAPNPFWDYCTLAVCTPNHQGVKASPGDWIVGFLSVVREKKLLYAMQVSEIIDLANYFHDPRFQDKKPDPYGSWKNVCGDNFYSYDDSGWTSHAVDYHTDCKTQEKDLRYHICFVSERFWYFGQNAPQVPEHFSALKFKYGTKSTHDPSLVQEFLKWLEERPPGVHGDPHDNFKLNGESDSEFECSGKSKC